MAAFHPAPGPLLHPSRSLAMATSAAFGAMRDVGPFEPGD